ncbi:MAG: PIN domain-containing protein [Parcubacteria group bacterium]|nr:PIN domain-containing protein [Parcubacteria group bacterium]
MPERLRIFLDTSAIIAGLNSPNGAAGKILAACFSHRIIPIISPQIIEEAERNISSKFPQLAAAWTLFMIIPPEIASTPSRREIWNAYKILPTDDAPILASAILAKPKALITWNTRDFLRESVQSAVAFPILVPGEFIAQFRKYL